MRRRYNAVGFLHNPYKRQPMACPLGRHMGLSFVSFESDLRSAAITAVRYVTPSNLDRINKAIDYMNL